jgi:hypothetical protein
MKLGEPRTQLEIKIQFAPSWLKSKSTMGAKTHRVRRCNEDTLPSDPLEFFFLCAFDPMNLLVSSLRTTIPGPSATSHPMSQYHVHLIRGRKVALNADITESNTLEVCIWTRSG